MSRRIASLLLSAFLLSSTSSLTACGDDEQVITSKKPKKKKKKAAKKGDTDDPEESKEPDKPLPQREYEADLFVESQENRDPYRNYAYLFVARIDGPQRVQRKVKAGAYSIDDLKLTGIISRGTRRAMFTDSSGFGWVMYTGDYVGKADVVNVGGSEGRDVEINWRIDRIRPKDIVFIREDAAHPEIPPTTRVVPLYPTGEVEAG